MTETNASKRPLFILLAVTLTMAAAGGVGYYIYQQQTPPPQTATPVVKKTNTAINTIKTPPVAEALTTLFGVKTSSNQVANEPDQLSSLWFEQSFSHADKSFHAVFIKTQSLDSETKEVIDSHAAAVNVSIVIYQLINNQWQLFSKQLNVGEFGSWGDVPGLEKAQILQLSSDNLAFLIDSGFSGQGYTEEGKGLFSFNFNNKTWKNLGFVQTGGDNEGTCSDHPAPDESFIHACWSFSGEITLAKTGKNPDYPDLLVKRRGTTSDDNNKIIPARDQLYTFNGEQYVEPGAEAR
jgi:hypothetical protein